MVVSLVFFECPDPKIGRENRLGKPSRGHSGQLFSSGNLLPKGKFHGPHVSEPEFDPETATGRIELAPIDGSVNAWAFGYLPADHDRNPQPSELGNQACLLVGGRDYVPDLD